MYELVTWTADGIEAMPLVFRSYADAVRTGMLYLDYGCAAYRVARA